MAKITSCSNCLKDTHYNCVGAFVIGNVLFACECKELKHNISKNLPKTNPYKKASAVSKQNIRAEVLQTAESLVNGDRADTYGSPQDSFGRVAALWNAMGFGVQRMVDGKYGPQPVTATDVALALTQLKVSRVISSPEHKDSWIDAAGYIALGAEIQLDKTAETFDS